MGKIINLKKFNIWKKIICLIICLFCAFSFVGCDEFEMDENGNVIIGGGDGSSDGGSTGGNDSTKNTLTTDESYFGVVAVYDIDNNAEVFYDKWTDSQLKFSDLVDRQFNALSAYLFDNLTRIYGDTTSTNTINGYGMNAITYSIENILSDGDDFTDSDIVQSDIAKLTTNGTTNASNLNYKNTINGGFTLSGSGSNWSYGSSVVENNEWNGKSVFTSETIKKALGYIYENVQPVENVDEEFSLTSMSNTSLKDYYCNFDLSNEKIADYTFDNIDLIGFSREYMWNVLYMLSYSLIGDTHIQDTLNNTSTVFSGSNGTIANITDSNKSAFEKYKGYDIVLTNLVRNAFNASINDGEIEYKDYFAKENWDTTLYPTMKRQEYIFYDDIDLVVFDEENNTIPKKLKSLIYIPNITDDEFIDERLSVGFIFVSLNTTEESNVETEIIFNGIFDDAELRNSKVIFNEEYDYVQNGNIVPIVGLDDASLIDGYFNYLDEVDYSFSSAVSGVDGVDIETLMNNSFVISEFTIENETHKKGTLNLYNQFIDVDEYGKVDYNIEKNYYYFTFNYYNSDGDELETTPNIYLTSFYRL